MIKPVCDSCKEELAEFGRILLSPPKGRHVEKLHLCKACYDKAIKLLKI